MNIDGTTRISFDEVEARLMYLAIQSVHFVGSEEEQTSIGKKLTKAYARLTGRYLRADVGLSWKAGESP